jgi:hypothetical protein
MMTDNDKYESWPAHAPHEILPGLWQGGTEDTDVLGQGKPADHFTADYPFDLVVTLYNDANPAPWGTEEVRFGFFDAALTDAAATTVVRLAHYTFTRWQAGATVLIRCQAGVNRSGLVSALTLMYAGYSATDAIALLRERRSPFVLSNVEFEWWLLNHAADAMADFLSPSPTPST